DFHLAAVVNLRHKIDLDTRQNQRQFLRVQLRREHTKNGFATGFKPAGDNDVVDVPEGIGFVEAGRNNGRKHRGNPDSTSGRLCYVAGRQASAPRYYQGAESSSAIKRPCCGRSSSIAGPA